MMDWWWWDASELVEIEFVVKKARGKAYLTVVDELGSLIKIRVWVAKDKFEDCEEKWWVDMSLIDY